jgi:hypothetical protein
MPVHADAKESLTHHFKSSHLLDAVRVEVLKLQPVREQHAADKPASGDGEAALVEGHERHHVPAGRAWHGLIDRDDPLDRLGKGRQLARLNETEELLAGDVGARQVRHHDGEVSSKLETQEAEAMWMRKNSELKGQVREKKEADGKQCPEPALDARF